MSIMRTAPSIIKEGGGDMGKTIRAKFSKGVIKPLEKLELEEGEEITVTILDLPESRPEEDPLDATAGAWVGLIDAEKFERDIYESRKAGTKPGVTL
jgi:predicted DNA-binding antitoxin AbrB/MazE fold protein